MKKVILNFLFIIFISENFYAATITSNGTGGGIWASTSTWSGGVVPLSSDNVEIATGDVVTLSANASCTNCTVNTDGTLDASSYQLTISGIFTLQSNATFKQGGSRTAVPGSSRSFDNASTFVFYGTQTSISSYYTFGNLIWSSSGNATPSGSLTINGDLTLLNSSSLRAASGTARSHTVKGNVVIDGSSSVLVGTAGIATGSWTISGNITTQNAGILRGCYSGS